MAKFFHLIFMSFIFLSTIKITPSFSTALPGAHVYEEMDASIRKDSWRELLINNPPSLDYIDNILLNIRNGESFFNIISYFKDLGLGEALNNSNLTRQHLTINFLEKRTPVSQYLIKSINEKERISRILKFQYVVSSIPSVFLPNEPSFWSIGDDSEQNTFRKVFLSSNPRIQQRVLNKRELARFDQIQANYNGLNPETPLFSHSNFETDDIIRALSLCGTFCGKDDDIFSHFFSGMLVPGQAYDAHHFNIHTCLHGFAGEQITDIYFIPYGLPLVDKYAFQVKYIFSDENGTNAISQDDLNGANYYARRDYALAVVDCKTLENITLKDIFQERQVSNLLGLRNIFPMFSVENHLPLFIGQGAAFNQDFKEFDIRGGKKERYFIIGRPGDPRMVQAFNNFSIVSNLTNDIVTDPRRSLIDNPDVLIPDGDIGFIEGEVAIDFPSMPGMSGGICVMSFIKEVEGNVQRLARPYAVTWGSERIFSDENKIINLKSIVSKIK